MLCIALDSCEPALLRRMLGEGRLPTIARLLERGRWSTVKAPLVGSAAAWPSFVTGGASDKDGISGEWVWNPSQMAIARLPETFDQIFYHRLQEEGVRVGVIDIPFTPEVEWPNGFTVNEWGVHHRISGRLWISPATAVSIVDSVPRHPYFGRNLRPDDPDDVLNLHATADASVEGVRLRGLLTRRLTAQFPCDLVLVSFQEIHHAGHYLWQATEPDHPLFGDISQEAKSLDDPVGATICEADAQLALALEQLRPSSVLLFSLNGMEAYRGTPDVLGPLLRREGFEILKGPRGKSAFRGAIAFLRRHAPGWFRELYHRTTSRERQLEMLRTGLLAPLDWTRTRALGLPSEEASPIQINLLGREAVGSVEEGRPYDEIMKEIEDLVLGLATGDGIPAVREVIRNDGEWERGPDALVYWDHSATYPPGKIEDVPAYEMLFPHHTAHHHPVGFCISHGDIAVELDAEIECRDLHVPIESAVQRLRRPLPK